MSRPPRAVPTERAHYTSPRYMRVVRPDSTADLTPELRALANAVKKLETRNNELAAYLAGAPSLAKDSRASSTPPPPKAGK